VKAVVFGKEGLHIILGRDIGPRIQGADLRASAARLAVRGCEGDDRDVAGGEPPRVWSARQLSFRAVVVASLFNLVIGVILAWVLGRDRVPGKRLIDAAGDLPVARPTANALTAIHAPNGVFGSVIPDRFGIPVADRDLGIRIALIAVGLIFVVGAVRPVGE
jgi:ABC-type sulfate transport system permease component